MATNTQSETQELLSSFYGHKHPGVYMQSEDLYLFLLKYRNATQRASSPNFLSNGDLNVLEAAASGVIGRGGVTTDGQPLEIISGCHLIRLYGNTSWYKSKAPEPVLEHPPFTYQQSKRDCRAREQIALKRALEMVC